MADLIVRVCVVLSFLWQLLFFILFMRTKWYKKELGAYVFRKELSIFIILLLSFTVNFIHDLPKDFFRPFAWILIQSIMFDQLRKFLFDSKKEEHKE